MQDPSTPPQANHDASAQIILMLGLLFMLGMLIVSNTAKSSPENPENEQGLISNPQIDESEVPIEDFGVPAKPIMMFNLENPNGWETPTSVTVVGTLQDEIGCDEDLIIKCEASHMTYDILGDIWQASMELPAGEYEYRVHLNASEDLVYGKNAVGGIHSFPISLAIDESQTVNFYYDHKTGWITDDVNSLILTLPGNFQDEVGCQEEWNASCFRTWMQDIEGDGIYTYETLLLPGGSWETRVALNKDLKTSYGQDGTYEGENIPLWIPNIGHLTVFTWDSNLNTLTIFVSNMPIRLSTDLPALAPNQ